MREVATTMAIKYPKMFENVKSSSDSPLGYYGLGGKMGNKFLDKHLVERVIINDRSCFDLAQHLFLVQSKR